MRSIQNSSDSSDNSSYRSEEQTQNFDYSQNSQFLYLPVRFRALQVSALIDTGSAINIISSDLYSSIPRHLKGPIITDVQDKLVLANGQTIGVLGTAVITMNISGTDHQVYSYVLQHSSHPIILGIIYLRENNMVLDFSQSVAVPKITKVICSKRTTVEPNSEVVVWGQLLPLLYGQQGLCYNSKYTLSRGLLVSKSLATISKNRTVPVRILNPTNNPITINKGKPIAQFESITSDHIIQSLDSSLFEHKVQHVNLEKVDSISVEADGFLDNFTFDQELPTSDMLGLKQFLCNNKDIFVTSDNPDLGCTDLVQHNIILKPDAKPKHQRPYRLPPDKRTVLRHHLDELLRQGIICPVDPCEDIPITSPIVLVSKRTREPKRSSTYDKEASLSHFRFCCDFRYLNSQTQTFSYAIPDLQELTESFSDRVPNFFSSIDLSSGFFQMKIDKTCSKYTAFNTCFGTYKFERLPMGLSTSPNSFQLLMDKILHGLTFKSCLCYLDDVLVCSETFQQHLEDLSEVFKRFRDAGLKLNPKKCVFAKSSCIFLGHHISKDGIRPPPDRVTAVQQYQSPKNVKELRRLLGFFNWFRKYIPQYSLTSQPLTRLLKKGVAFKWTDAQEKALSEMKTRLLNSDVLAFPRFNIPFYLAVDTSSKGIGYMLYQKHQDENGSSIDRVIRFGSKTLNHWQSSYGPTKLELLGVVTSITDCASYLRGNHFVVECDHQALRPLLQKQLKGAIYERWLAILQQYNFDIVYKPAAQMCVPDALSRCMNSDATDGITSPDESDPFFPYVAEQTGQIQIVENTGKGNGIISFQNKGVFVSVVDCEQDSDGYMADTEDDETITIIPEIIVSSVISSQQLGNDSISDTFVSARSSDIPVELLEIDGVSDAPFHTISTEQSAHISEIIVPSKNICVQDNNKDLAGLSEMITNKSVLDDVLSEFDPLVTQPLILSDGIDSNSKSSLNDLFQLEIDSRQVNVVDKETTHKRNGIKRESTSSNGRY